MGVGGLGAGGWMRLGGEGFSPGLLGFTQGGPQPHLQRTGGVGDSSQKGVSQGMVTGLATAVEPQGLLGLLPSYPGPKCLASNPGAGRWEGGQQAGSA